VKNVKKQLTILLFVFVVAIGLSSAASAAPVGHGASIKLHKQKVVNKQSNSQSNDIKALIINSPGARVTGTNIGLNTASTTIVGASGIDDIGDIVFDVVDQAVWNKQNNRQSNKIRALIINSPGAVVSGTNVAENELGVA
jgi:hypothetical protein